MKNIRLFLLLLAVMKLATLSAQSFSINCENGDVLYLDISNSLTAEVEGYDSTKILLTTSLPGILQGENGKYQVNLTQSKVGDQILIDVWVDKEDGMYEIGKKKFTVSRKNDFEIGLGQFRTHEHLSLEQFKNEQKLTVVGSQENTEFSVAFYSCSVISKDGDAEFFQRSDAFLFDQIWSTALKMGPGTRVLFDKIILTDKSGVKKNGSPLNFTLTQSSERHYALGGFKDGKSYSSSEIAERRNLSAFLYSGDIRIDSYPLIIQSFEIVLLPKTGKPESFSNNTNRLSDVVLENIHKLKLGDKIRIDNLMVGLPDGTQRKCTPVLIYIR